MIYIASPFFTPEQVEQVAWLEQTLERHGEPYFSPRLVSGVLNEMDPTTRAVRLRDVFLSNIEGMRRSKTMFANVTAKDTGTTWEMGWWYGAKEGASLFTFSLSGAPANVMISQSASGHFISKYEFEAFIASESFRYTKQNVKFKRNRIQETSE